MTSSVSPAAALPSHTATAGAGEAMSPSRAPAASSRLNKSLNTSTSPKAEAIQKMVAAACAGTAAPSA